jgi:hypothetical protein
MQSRNISLFAELEGLVQIDRDNLATELINHSSYYWHASKEAVNAISLRDAAKSDVDNYEANLNITFRHDAVQRNERVTEALVDALVKSDNERIRFVERYLKAKREAELWIALRDSFVQKGYAMKELVTVLRTGDVAESSYAQQRLEALTNLKKPD